ncbi:hypothetical protein ACUNV4_13910 [Granulosicoccus sp. 3-233]|uniref:hypothetical protein n=1 Tax=Granulosicoccus sp. 3-233 TaxID=3417969 RepID=UPI003D342CF0
MKPKLLRSLLAASTFVFASVSLAEGPVSGHISAYTVTVDADGKEIIQPTAEARPGELMEYRLIFVNNGKSEVSGMSIVDPIPANTTFVSDSANSNAESRFEVSVDGGRTFESEPVLRIETQADGSQKQVVIPPSQYTHVRWAAVETLDGEGGTQQYAYRVTVD